MPAVALALTKRAPDESWSNDLDAQLDLEREAGLTPDFAEGTQAFLRKRPPVFMRRGRRIFDPPRLGISPLVRRGLNPVYNGRAFPEWRLSWRTS